MKTKQKANLISSDHDLLVTMNEKLKNLGEKVDGFKEDIKENYVCHKDYAALNQKVKNNSTLLGFMLFSLITAVFSALLGTMLAR